MDLILRDRVRAAVTAAIVCNSMPVVWAETVYRCAHLYSDRPCPGAVAIEARDARTPQQKAQSDRATQAIAQTANHLERERRTLESAQLRSAAATRPYATTSTPRPAGSKPPGKEAPAKSLQKPQAPPFTAIAGLQPQPAPEAKRTVASPPGR